MENGASGRAGDRFVLTEAQRRDYEDQGYIVLRNVLSASECDALEQDFMQFIRGEVPGMGRDFCDMSGPYDRRFEDFNLINAMLPRNLPTFVAGEHVFERVTHRDVAEQLIGDSATLDYDQFLAKKPGKEAAAVCDAPGPRLLADGHARTR